MKVNGTIIDLQKPQNLHDFLMSETYDLTHIAVERNGEIIPKANYKDTMLDNEDNLEIVRFVGGG